MTDAAPSVESRFSALQHELGGCLAEIRALASTAATTTGVTWDAVVQAMTGAPRRALPAAGQGANPAEVREVLIAVRELYARRLAVVEAAMRQADPGEAIVDAIWTFRHRRLDRLVDEELEAYIKAVTPKPTVAGVFAKAASAARTQPATVPVAIPAVQLHRCKTCSAPRLGECLYGNCLYCGQPFFTGREEIE